MHTKQLLFIAFLVFPLFILAQTESRKGENIIRAEAGTAHFFSVEKNSNNYTLSLEYMKRITERFSLGGVYRYGQTNSGVERNISLFYYTNNKKQKVVVNSVGAKAAYDLVATPRLRFSAELGIGAGFAGRYTIEMEPTPSKEADIPANVDMDKTRPIYKMREYTSVSGSQANLFVQPELKASYYITKKFFVGAGAYTYLSVLNSNYHNTKGLMNPSFMGFSLSAGAAF